MPHLLTDEQKRQRVKAAKKLLQCFQNMTKSSLPMSSHVMKPGSIILYAIFFSGEGVAIKVPVKKGKSITGKYYKDVVLKKLKKELSEKTPCHWF